VLFSKHSSRAEQPAIRAVSNPSSTKENLNPHSSVNTLEDEEFPSSTDLTDLSELSLHSPSSSTNQPIQEKKSLKAPFSRSKTTFDSPGDTHMSEPSPMSISSLALSPRRNGAVQVSNEAPSKNIFADAQRRAKWELTLAYTSDDDDDDIPDLPSPTRPKMVTDPFKRPARPGMMRQNTTATMQRLTTQPTLFPAISGGSGATAAVGEATASAIPRTATEPDMRPNGLSRSPSRRLSKIPSSISLAGDAVSPKRRGLPKSANGLEPKQAKEGGDEMLKAVMQRNIGQGRTLVELAQARAGGRPLSMDTGKQARIQLQGTKIVAERPDLDRDLPPVPIWDPEHDDMPSPFLARGTKVVRGLR